MAAVKKFVRAVNFTLEEEHRLLDVVETYIKVIECKRTDAFTWKEKNEKWKQVAFDFNSGSSNKRSERELKLKYECLKKAARKEANRQKQLMSGSGSSPQNPPRNTAVLERVLHLVPLNADGMLSKFDRESDSWTPRIASPESQENSDIDESQQTENLEDEELQSELTAPVFGGCLQPEWNQLTNDTAGFADRLPETGGGVRRPRGTAARYTALATARTELVKLQMALLLRQHEESTERLAQQHEMDLKVKEADLKLKEADLQIKYTELEILRKDLQLRNVRLGKESSNG